MTFRGRMVNFCTFAMKVYLLTDIRGVLFFHTANLTYMIRLVD